MGAHVRQDNVIVLRLWRYVSHVLTYLLTYLLNTPRSRTARVLYYSTGYTV